MVLHKSLPFQTLFLGKNEVQLFPEPHEAFTFARDLAELKTLQGDNRSFFVMDINRVSLLLDEWFTCLPRVQPYYSVNCNADSVLLRLLAKHPSVGFNCTTKESLEATMEVATPERVLYANPCWTRGALRYARDAGIQLLAFDSAQSLDRIYATCPDSELLLNVCLDPMADDSNAAIGCPLQEAPELLQLTATLGLNCIGIGFNIGSGCREASLYTTAIEVAANLFEIGRSCGLDMKLLNIGGGFANSYFQNQDQYATFADICQAINDGLEFFFPQRMFPNLNVIAKPGRFFAAPSFSLVTNIIGKHCVDASQVTNDDFDLGNDAFIYQINEGYYGSFGCRVVANCEPQCTPLFGDGADTLHYYGSVCGPTLDEFDMVQPMCRFRQMEPGDWLLWENMGAYSMHNRAMLEESEEKEGPIVYYFATVDEWNKLNGTQSDVVQKVFPNEPINNGADSTDPSRACTPMSISSGEDDARSITSEESNEPEDDIWRMLWPLYEYVGK